MLGSGESGGYADARWKEVPNEESLVSRPRKVQVRHMTAIPLIDSFWLMLAFYVIHILDESLLGGSFVQKYRSTGGQNIPG
jgi:hypothetical protein